MRSGAILITGLLLAALLCACDTPKFEPARQTVYLDQGDYWDSRARALYYYTPQGTMLHALRYSWFQNLEVSKGQRLADPSYLSRFGFIYAPEQLDPNFDGGELNPGNLPVGFASHVDEETGEAMLDVSCALCHTGQLDYKGISLRVDGGQPMHAFASTRPDQFVPKLVGAMTTTFADPMKFDRFAERVLGTRYPDAKEELRGEFEKSIAGFTREAVTTAGINDDDGYGLLDALGRISNTVLGEDLDRRNLTKSNAPVSYPHLWDIWKFDWVQWNGSVAQPMGRNVGEALGVKARLDLVDEHGTALPPDELFKSAVLLREQHCIETALWQLGPPRWPENIFPAINAEKAMAGKALFVQRCQGCHGPHVYPEVPEEPVTKPVRYDCSAPTHEAKPTPDKPVEWKMCVVPAWDIGTDPQVVNNYLDERYDASALDVGDPSLRSVSAGRALELLMQKVSDKKIKELGISDTERWAMEGWGRQNETRDMRGYKARPLHGVWATPPFLHNGSVRTIYELLSPHGKREQKTWIGSREFDPVHIGYENRQVENAFERDTRKPGNLNTGHQFTNDGGIGVIGPELTHDERMALIEYIKILGNPKYDPDYEVYAAPWAGPIECGDKVQGPAQSPELKWPH